MKLCFWSQFTNQRVNFSFFTTRAHTRHRLQVAAWNQLRLLTLTYFAKFALYRQRACYTANYETVMLPFLAKSRLFGVPTTVLKKLYEPHKEKEVGKTLITWFLLCLSINLASM